MNARIGFVTQTGLELDEQLTFAGEAGFDYVEVLMDGDDRRERLADRASTIRDRLDAGGLDLAVHLPFPTDLGSPYPEIRDGAIAAQRACIETAVDLGAEKGVLHPESNAWGAAWDDADVRGYVDDSVDGLASFGADRGFEVCAENLFGGVYTIETIDGLLDRTSASMTLDTGHARIAGYESAETAAFVADHADRISHVHLNDTRVASDEHLPIGAGTIDFAAILDAFPADWEGTLSLEVATESYDYLRHSKAHLDELL